MGFIDVIKGLIPKRKKRKTPIAASYIFGGFSYYNYKRQQEDYVRMFREIPAVRASVDAIVNAIFSNGWRVRTFPQSDDETKDPRIKTILRWINEEPLYFEEALRSIAYNLILRHDAYIEIRPKDEGVRGNFYVLDPTYCKLILSDDNIEIIGLQYAADPNNPVILPPDNFVHINLTNLGSNITGLSPLESVVDSANLYIQGKEYAIKLFESGGVPLGAIVLEEGSDDDYEILVESLRGEKKIGEILALRGKIDFKKMGSSQDEMQYVDLAEQATNDIQMVFQVPSQMIGMGVQAKKESAKEERNAFSSKVRSLQIILSKAITMVIRKIFGEYYNDIVFEFNMWVDEASRAAIHKIYLTTGVMTPNEVRRELGLPPVKWGDEPFSPNFTPKLLYEDKKQKQSEQTKASTVSELSPSGNTDPVRPEDQNVPHNEVKVSEPNA